MTPSIYPIPGPWKGQLAILARPRGGDWLADEIQYWRGAGFDVVVSLLDLAEQEELGLTEEGSLAEAQDIRFFSFPILDRGVPHSLSATAALLVKLRHEIQAGKSVRALPAKHRTILADRRRSADRHGRRAAFSTAASCSGARRSSFGYTRAAGLARTNARGAFVVGESEPIKADRCPTSQIGDVG